MSCDLELELPPGPTPDDDRDAAALGAAAALALRVDLGGIQAVRIRRVAFDARPRYRQWQVAVTVWMSGEVLPERTVPSPPRHPSPGPDAPRVVVIGSGPAGMFCTLELLASGIAVTLVERGADVRGRRRPIAEVNRGAPVDPECNYCFGEGGAGTFSDGKLYTRAGAKPEVRAVLEALYAHGAPPQILTSWRPHIGSNRLPEVVQAMRESILANGGEIRFDTRAVRLETGADGVTAVVVRARAEAGDGDAAEERLECAAAVLATGHSALDAIEMAAAAGARLEPKGFAMGVRIEHPQDWLDQRQYGGLRAEHDLPAAFYEVKATVDGRAVYSFCMCPGGFIVPATTAPDRLVINGMSLARRDSPFANSGIVVAIEPEDWCGERGQDYGWPAILSAAGFEPELPATPADAPSFGVRLQHAVERLAARAGSGSGRAPVQRADLFRAGSGDTAPALKTSYHPGLTPCDLRRVLPRGIADRLRIALGVFDKKLPGFASANGQLVAVESRTSSPVRVARDHTACVSATVPGLYPCGEGAGYAGGIVSAAIDGRRVARAIAAAR